MRTTPLRILIVEDDALTAAAFAAALRDRGHSIVGIAEDSRQAVAAAARYPTDLALVDLNLRDGQTGLRAAKALNDNFVPTLLVSGEPGLASKAAEVHALGYIPKPADADDVVRVIDFLQRQALAPVARIRH